MFGRIKAQAFGLVYILVGTVIASYTAQADELPDFKQLYQSTIQSYNHAEAAPHFAAWAERGNLCAQREYGKWMQKGRYGVPKDPEGATKYLSKAAQAGDTEIQQAVAWDMLKGRRGFQQDAKAGFAFLKEAALHGSERSMSYTGAFYADGTGVEPDLVKAYAWLDARRIVDITSNQLESHKNRAMREEVGSRMHANQKARAKSIAKKLVRAIRKPIDVCARYF